MQAVVWIGFFALAVAIPIDIANEPDYESSIEQSIVDWLEKIYIESGGDFSKISYRRSPDDIRIESQTLEDNVPTFVIVTKDNKRYKIRIKKTDRVKKGFKKPNNEVVHSVRTQSSYKILPVINSLPIKKHIEYNEIIIQTPLDEADVLGIRQYQLTQSGKSAYWLNFGKYFDLDTTKPKDFQTAKDLQLLVMSFLIINPNYEAALESIKAMYDKNIKGFNFTLKWDTEDGNKFLKVLIKKYSDQLANTDIVREQLNKEYKNETKKQIINQNVKDRNKVKEILIKTTLDQNDVSTIKHLNKENFKAYGTKMSKYLGLDINDSQNFEVIRNLYVIFISYLNTDPVKDFDSVALKVKDLYEKEISRKKFYLKLDTENGKKYLKIIVREPAQQSNDGLNEVKNEISDDSDYDSDDDNSDEDNNNQSDNNSDNEDNDDDQYKYDGNNTDADDNDNAHNEQHDDSRDNEAITTTENLPTLGPVVDELPEIKDHIGFLGLGSSGNNEHEFSGNHTKDIERKFKLEPESKLNSEELHKTSNSLRVKPLQKTQKNFSDDVDKISIKSELTPDEILLLREKVHKEPEIWEKFRHFFDLDIKNPSHVSLLEDLYVLVMSYIQSNPTVTFSKAILTVKNLYEAKLAKYQHTIESVNVQGERYLQILLEKPKNETSDSITNITLDENDRKSIDIKTSLSINEMLQIRTAVDAKPKDNWKLYFNYFNLDMNNPEDYEIFKDLYVILWSYILTTGENSISALATLKKLYVMEILGNKYDFEIESINGVNHIKILISDFIKEPEAPSFDLYNNKTGIHSETNIQKSISENDILNNSITAAYWAPIVQSLGLNINNATDLETLEKLYLILKFYMETNPDMSYETALSAVNNLYEEQIKNGNTFSVKIETINDKKYLKMYEDNNKEQPKEIRPEIDDNLKIYEDDIKEQLKDIRPEIDGNEIKEIDIPFLVTERTSKIKVINVPSAFTEEEIFKLYYSIDEKPLSTWAPMFKIFGLDIHNPKDIVKFKNLYAIFMSYIKTFPKMNYEEAFKILKKLYEDNFKYSDGFEVEPYNINGTIYFNIVIYRHQPQLSKSISTTFSGNANNLDTESLPKEDVINLKKIPVKPKGPPSNSNFITHGNEKDKKIILISTFVSEVDALNMLKFVGKQPKKILSLLYNYLGLNINSSQDNDNFKYLFLIFISYIMSGTDYVNALYAVRNLYDDEVKGHQIYGRFLTENRITSLKLSTDKSEPQSKVITIQTTNDLIKLRYLLELHNYKTSWLFFLKYFGLDVNNLQNVKTVKDLNIIMLSFLQTIPNIDYQTALSMTKHFYLTELLGKQYLLSFEYKNGDPVLKIIVQRGTNSKGIRLKQRRSSHKGKCPHKLALSSNYVSQYPDVNNRYTLSKSTLPSVMRFGEQLEQILKSEESLEALDRNSRLARNIKEILIKNSSIPESNNNLEVSDDEV